MFTGRPGWGEILVIVLVIVLFFGAKRIPDIARALGKSLNEFKKGREEGAQPEKKDGGDAAPPPA